MRSKKPPPGPVVSAMSGKALHRIMLPIYKEAIKSKSRNVGSIEISDLWPADGPSGQYVIVTFWRKSPRKRKVSVRHR